MSIHLQLYILSFLPFAFFAYHFQSVYKINQIQSCKQVVKLYISVFLIYNNYRLEVSQLHWTDLQLPLLIYKIYCSSSLSVSIHLSLKNNPSMYNQSHPRCNNVPFAKGYEPNLKQGLCLLISGNKLFYVEVN